MALRASRPVTRSSAIRCGYAEYTLLPAGASAHKPETLSFVDAATLPVAAATAFDGIAQPGLPPGSVLLITASVAAWPPAQIARHARLAVIGTASAGKKDFVEAFGVVHVLPAEGVAERVSGAAPNGIDAIYDLIGGADLEAVAGVLADGRNDQRRP